MEHWSKNHSPLNLSCMSLETRVSNCVMCHLDDKKFCPHERFLIIFKQRSGNFVKMIYLWMTLFWCNFSFLPFKNVFTGSWFLSTSPWFLSFTGRRNIKKLKLYSTPFIASIHSISFCLLYFQYMFENYPNLEKNADPINRPGNITL